MPLLKFKKFKKNEASGTQTHFEMVGYAFYAASFPCEGNFQGGVYKNFESFTEELKNCLDTPNAASIEVVQRGHWKDACKWLDEKVGFEADYTIECVWPEADKDEEPSFLEEKDEKEEIVVLIDEDNAGDEDSFSHTEENEEGYEDEDFEKCKSSIFKTSSSMKPK